MATYPPYTTEEFEKLARIIDTTANDILEAKKHAYSPNADRLEDFHFVAQALGIEPEMVAMVYTLKHVQSLAVMIRNKDYQWYDKGKKEGLLSRIADIQNLLKFVAACIDEKTRPDLEAWMNGNRHGEADWREHNLKGSFVTIKE